MQVAETKTSAAAKKTIQKKRQPFFNKEGQDSFFSKSTQHANPFFSAKTIQPKLTLGQPNDKYEIEADVMADKVVQRLAAPDVQTKSEVEVQAKPLFASVTPLMQPKCATCQLKDGGSKEEDLLQKSPLKLMRKPIFESNSEPPDDEGNIQRKCATCEKEEEKLQTKAEGNESLANTPSIENRLISSKGGGAPLSDNTRVQMEASFGTDFSGVRVHTNSSAVQMNKELSAQAFTHGSDIYFNEGKYNTNSKQGVHLLAHELTHTVQQGSVKGTEGTVQRGLWDDIKGVARGVGNRIASGASAVGSAISSGISVIGDALGSAWSKASTFLGSTASWAYEGLKSLGSQALNWLSTAGSHVWSAIKWLGSKAWDGIKWLGTFLWEKLSLIGSNLWSFLSNIPIRLWRIIVHGWEGIKGVLSWTWAGLQGAARHVWKGIVGLFSWLGKGVEGAIKWILGGVQSGYKWALDFIQDPSLPKLWDALTGSLSWAWEGLKGFGQWGWDGVVAAAVWVWKGLKGFGSWLWDGFVRGAEWVGRLLLYVLDLIGFWEALQIMWGLIFRLRKLTDPEIAASLMVHPKGMIPYDLVRVDEGSWVARISGYFSGGGYRAVTTIHVLHVAPGESLHTMVHELSHIAQYEHVGSVYMAEAIHAQAFGAGYGYTDSSGALLHAHFWEFNREQQASICEDYYIAGADSSTTASALTLRPLIGEMRAGKF